MGIPGWFGSGLVVRGQQVHGATLHLHRRGGPAGHLQSNDGDPFNLGLDATLKNVPTDRHLGPFLTTVRTRLSETLAEVLLRQFLDNQKAFLQSLKGDF